MNCSEYIPVKTVKTTKSVEISWTYRLDSRANASLFYRPRCIKNETLPNSFTDDAATNELSCTLKRASMHRLSALSPQRLQQNRGNGSFPSVSCMTFSGW